MKFVELVTRLAQDPIYARPLGVMVKDDKITYAFRIGCYRGADRQNHHMSRQADYKRAVEVTASVLQLIFPEFDISPTDSEEVHISYRASPSEIEFAKRYLDTLARETNVDTTSLDLRTPALATQRRSDGGR